ncbi:PhzF family phenazine biosynthesis protein [Arenimonas sp.]|uniref:PhzF family phenazine biosynthesis protein n=1 Tax=Arenimonas sp. TaxID=1872635 RepID=UPI0035AF5EBD
MHLQRIAAFSESGRGGNPAGVVLADALPDAASMQALAADVGYSETVFAAPAGDAWRVRYFSPLAEVPFCGHATIALGAALANREGDGVYALQLSRAHIQVEAWRERGRVMAALQSPPTRSRPAEPGLVSEAMALFDLDQGDLDPSLPPGLMHAGADHLLLALRDRQRLASMRYPFEAGRRLMQDAGLTTIALVVAESPQRFHARNAFAIGGVVEDPATGAAAAALGGMLRDLGWPHGGAVDILQGQDMGSPSRLHVQVGPEPGESVRVSGETHRIDD